MRKFTFRGGIHPPTHKDEKKEEISVKIAPLPGKVVLPLVQHIGAPNKPIVNKGDEVQEGQVIAKTESFVSSPVLSSITGKVTEIKKAFHPALGPIESIFIERDPGAPALKYSEHDASKYTKEEILAKIKAAGIVGMGGAAFPTHVKLSVPQGKTIHTLIINGAECEPYLECDHALMETKVREILKGIALLERIIQPKNVYLAIEDNKKEIFKKFNGKVETKLLKTKYPQGGEKQLIKAITGKEVPPGGLPLDIGFVVQNVGTAYAVYEAVCCDKPLIERIVTIAGDCAENSGNYLVRIGSLISDVIESCDIHLIKEPAKIIAGGPMMGIAQMGQDAPILKNTSGVLLLSGKAAKIFEERNCIKCAKCVDVCPVRLVPTDIMKNAKKLFYDKAEKLFAADCIECGSCSYICPARIPLVQYIKDAKKYVMDRKKA